MSSDLLAEFDSFYRAPEKASSNSTPASNDLSFLSNTNQNRQQAQGGAFTQWQTPATNASEDIWGGMTGLQHATPQQQPATAQNDTWGSFETIHEKTNTPFQGQDTNQGISAKPYSGSIQNNQRIIRRSTLDLFSGNTHDVENVPTYQTTTKSTQMAPHAPRSAPNRKSSSGGEILFDADDAATDPEDDDDFGDFETVTSPEPQPRLQLQPNKSLDAMFGATSLNTKAPHRPADLLSTTTLNSNALPYPQAPKSPSFRERNPFAELGVATSYLSSLKKEDGSKSASPVTAWPTFEPTVPKADLYRDSPVAIQQEEEWGDFADLALETSVPPNAKTASGIEDDRWGWDTADQVPEAAPQVGTAPPTNIPPPSVLLALFPQLFDLPQSTLFKPVANQTFSSKNRILSDPKTVEFLRSYLLIAVVAARLIAGRKLRWKRDTLLSQAMKIGPAAAGGKGGMKLTGVDKAETTREDREAVESVRIWKEQLGRLRSAVAVANSSIKDASTHLKIPEIDEAMHVKTQEGALTAPKQCIICGLKREERINRVDVEVEDSFGEWWVEHWGHRSCRNFWSEHESKLKHR